MPYLFYQLRKKLADVQGELPAGLIGPTVNDEFGDVDSILYMMTGDGADYAQLKKVAEGCASGCSRCPASPRSISTAPRTRRSSSSSRTPSWRRSASRRRRCSIRLAKQNAVVPAGMVETSAQRVPLRVTGALDGVKAVAETPVEATAACSAWATSPPSPAASSIRRASWRARRASPRSASAWSWPRAPTSSSSARRSPNATARFMKAVPQGIDIEQIADQPQVVEHAVGEFVRSFLEALAIVLFV